MPIDANVEKVSFQGAKELVVAALSCDQPVMLIGDPGVGKSALAALVAKDLGLPLETLIGSTLDATDVGGLPTVSDKHGVRRYPLPAVKAACAAPRLLFLDELATSGATVQAAMLRLTLERWAGDDKLHPDTRVLLATNPEEQSPGGMPISAPLIGRVAFAHLVPTLDEVCDHFDLFQGEVRLEAQDWIACAKAAPDLLEVRVPDRAAGGNVPWGSPRAWERALRLRARIAASGGSEQAKRAATAASVGRAQAAAHAGILEVRQNLPSVDDIARDPFKTAVPDDGADATKKNLRIAAVSLLPRVAEVNSWSAWVYANRLDPEMRAISARILLKKVDHDRSVPHAAAGAKARIKVLASIGSSLRASSGGGK